MSRGVAEQFAITVATLSAWSSLEEEEMNYGSSSQEIIQLQDLESIYLQEKLLPCPQVINSRNVEDSLPASSSSTHTSPTARGHPGAEKWNSRHIFPGDLPHGPPGRQLGEGAGLHRARAGEHDQRLPEAAQQLPAYADSSSLSEDEVFYN